MKSTPTLWNGILPILFEFICDNNANHIPSLDFSLSHVSCMKFNQFLDFPMSYFPFP